MTTTVTLNPGFFSRRSVLDWGFAVLALLGSERGTRPFDQRLRLAQVELGGGAQVGLEFHQAQRFFTRGERALREEHGRASVAQHECGALGRRGRVVRHAARTAGAAAGSPRPRARWPRSC